MAAVVDAVPALRRAADDLLAGDGLADDDYYLSSDIGGQVDHHVLYFGLDEKATAHLQAADVLFLGNSRVMYALRPQVLRPAFAALGLDYYGLGFGFREADRFPLAIIRRFDLRPRVVVVNADGFFGGGLSTWAEVVNRDTVFAARKIRWEIEIAHNVRSRMQQVAPNWLALIGRPGLDQGRRFNTYRSRIDGTWLVSPWPTATRTFLPPEPERREIGRGELAAARAFKAEMDARGITLVLTMVPTPRPFEGAAAARFATLLDVPLIVVEPPGMTSSDDSHLDAPSAFDWSRAFMAAFTPLLRASGVVPPR